MLTGLTRRLFVRPMLTSRTSAWITLLLGVLVMGAIMSMPVNSSDGAPNSLPADSQAAFVAQVVKDQPGIATAPALIVMAADSQLTAQQRSEFGKFKATAQQIADDAAVQAGFQPAPPAPAGAPPFVVSEDKQALLMPVAINSKLLGTKDNVQLVKDIRQELTSAFPADTPTYLTGGPAVAADIGMAFEGADFTLLAVTAAVVALLLLITYRSPILWLVPLIIIALADRAATIVVSQLAEVFDIVIDGSTSGITNVLVFGAGTNYALLLISRYREELRTTSDHFAALRQAVAASTGAILSSNLTVVFSLAVLLLSLLPSNRALGFSAGVGLLVALASVMLLLPAALAVCGRKLFWPFIPAEGDKDTAHDGMWAKIARAVSARPWTVLLPALIALLALAAGIFSAQFGLPADKQFRTATQSTEGIQVIGKHFPAGNADPLIVLAKNEEANQVRQLVDSTAGVTDVRVNPSVDDGVWKRLDVIVDATPSSDETYAIIGAIKDSFAAENLDARIGGNSAKTLEIRDGQLRDLSIVVPTILVIILLVLFLVLRCVIAPLVLITATTLSAAAAIGLGFMLSTSVFGFVAVDLAVPLFSFLFLVALGIDYTIFLAVRAQEETPQHGTYDGIIRAVGATGGVITSAGIVLAAVFVVLGVLPLVTLTQIGIVVGIGILLDTFIVRTVVVPAVFRLIGPRIWWPSALNTSQKETLS